MTTDAHDAPEWPFTRTDPLLPPPLFAQLRETCPVSRVQTWDGAPTWVATRYEDVKAILRSPFISADPGKPGYPNAGRNHAAARQGQKGFLRMDSPEHDVQRRMLTKSFSVTNMMALRPFVETLVDELLDAMEERGGPVDLMRALAEPLPTAAICEILDVPVDDSVLLLDYVSTFTNFESPPDVSAKAAGNLNRYLDDLVTSRAGSDREDLVSVLVRLRLETGQVTRPELLSMLSLVVVGGFDTTTNMIALGTILLLRNPDQMEDLRAHPEIVSTAIEELLRYLSVTHQASSRASTGDLPVGEVCIHAGEGVLAPVLAANHDPSEFSDPERLDLRRDARSHVAFGFGVHQCLGQNLARVELEVVFTKLLSRFPTLRLAVTEDEIDFKNSMIYGVRALPVTW